MKLWLDDERTPPGDDWIWVTTPDVALWHLRTYVGLVEVISFDHDLGIDIRRGHEGDTLDSRPVMLWLCENPVAFPKDVRVHTGNPVGREWLEGMIERYKP